MIYVTGDLHGDIDRLNHPMIKKLKFADVLIVCGDFGFVWNGSKEEAKFLKKIGKRRYDTVFVEGCHDNYALLREYPIVTYRGGKARQISGNLYQLLRGEVYEICGKKVFAFGGGDSGESGLDNPRWQPDEQPSEEEQQHGVDTLRACHGKVDFIVTHDAPATIKRFLNLNENEESCIHLYLDYLSKHCDFEKWFFGCYHLDKVIPPRYIGLFRDVYRAE